MLDTIDLFIATQSRNLMNFDRFLGGRQETRDRRPCSHFLSSGLPMRVHRLDQINAEKPANLLGFRSLTLNFRSKQIGRFFCVSRPSERYHEVQPFLNSRRLGQDLSSETNVQPSARIVFFWYFSSERTRS